MVNPVRLDYFQNIVNVGWPTSRFWMFISTNCTDGSFGPSAASITLDSIGGPFSPLILLDRFFNPVPLTTIPAGYPGISQVIDTSVPIDDQQLLVTGTILKSDRTVKQWTYEQWNESPPIETPEQWFKDNFAAFNLSVVDRDHFPTISLAGHCTLASASTARVVISIQEVTKFFDPLIPPIRNLFDFGAFTSFKSSGAQEFFKEGSDPVTTVDFPWSISLDMETKLLSDSTGGFELSP